MSLGETIRADLVAATKAKDAGRMSVLRMIIAAAKNAAIEKHRELTDDETILILRTEAKRLREAEEDFHRGGRPDLVAQNQAERRVIEAYLPQMMDEGAVRQIVQTTLAGRVSDPKQIGKITGEIMAAHKGKMDGAMLSRIIKEEMSG